MPETGTSINEGNQPLRGNGEGVAKASPLPTSDGFGDGLHYLLNRFRFVIPEKRILGFGSQSRNQGIQAVIVLLGDTILDLPQFPQDFIGHGLRLPSVRLAWRSPGMKSLGVPGNKGPERSAAYAKTYPLSVFAQSADIPSADSFDYRFCLGVVDMPTIPGEKIIDAVNGSYGDVQCVIQCLSGDATIFNEGLGQSNRLICQWKQLDSLQRGESPFYRVAVASRCFLDNQIRDAQGKSASLDLPPIHRLLLPSGGSEIA